jgi:hypothetical protein
MALFEELLLTFYTVPRAGQRRLSDGGGPFGFDITTALQVDFLIAAYQCDGIVETGCYLGDTSEYLTRLYASLPLRTCDLDESSAAFTRARLRHHNNAQVWVGDSAELLPSMLDGLDSPLVFLDAHWGDGWPLVSELSCIQRGIIVIDDFFIGHSRFGYDRYDGIACDPALVAAALPDANEMFVGNPYADYPAPCMQTGRRSGTGYLVRGRTRDHIRHSPLFKGVPLRPKVALPKWPTALGTSAAGCPPGQSPRFSDPLTSRQG